MKLKIVKISITLVACAEFIKKNPPEKYTLLRLILQNKLNGLMFQPIRAVHIARYVKLHIARYATMQLNR